MKLVSLKPENIGPFAPNEELTLERDVTVITGANDTGKSMFLRLIAMVCAKSKDSVAKERDVNLDYLLQAKSLWNQDSNIACEASFVEPSATYHCKLAPGEWSNGRIRTSGFSGPIGNNPKKLPNFIAISRDPDEAIREELPLNEPNTTERRFLKLAFGNFSFNALTKLSNINFQSSILNAEETLNSKLRSFLPQTLPFEFKFTNMSDKREILFVHLVDPVGGTTGLGYRGTGIQKLITLLGRIAVENLATEDTIITFDEPENALHADAQHTLRKAFEDLARDSHFQVVYATHSSCMVNSMRPTSVRLLERVKRDGRAYSVMAKDAFAGNFARVRSSLGISPADSLLYAPVTLIVEGKTEVISLPIILTKLTQAGIAGFEQVEQILSSSIFLEAEGTGNIGNLCRIALAQSSYVVVFVDGDNENRWRQQLQHYPAVPVIAIPEKKEFEEILPTEIYFNALATELESDKINPQSFDTWKQAVRINPKLAFTKQIERWLTDGIKVSHFPKPAVMERASIAVNANDISVGPLQRMILAMRQGVANV